MFVMCNLPPCAANCGVPKSPGNGTIVNYTSTVEGSTLLYQCNPGFGPVGEMTAVCTASGNWSPDPADVICREIGLYIATASSYIEQVPTIGKEKGLN